MSRKRFDEFYEFDGSIENLKQKISIIKVSGTSTTRRLNNGDGNFFFGIHDNYGNNKRLAVVFKTKEESELIYSQLFGE